MADITHNIDWIVQRLLDRHVRRGCESNDEMRARRQQERETAAAALTALQAERDAWKARAEAAEENVGILQASREALEAHVAKLQRELAKGGGR